MTPPPRRPGSKPGLTSEQQRDVFSQCCAARSPAVLLCGETGTTYQGRFTKLTRTNVVFLLSIPSSELVVAPLSVFCVTFNQGGRARVFLAPLVGVDRSGPVALVALELPDQIATAEGRVSFRVPVTATSGLLVRLTTDEGLTLQPGAVDLSTSGVQVCLEEADPALSIGAAVRVQLAHSARYASISAVVRRREGNRYGLSFPQSIREGELVPPPELSQILRSIEAHWLGGDAD